MFGWEFPPHISGGLGTACFGLTKGLSHLNNVEVTFVVPSATVVNNTNNIHLISADKVKIVNYKEGELGELKLLKVNSRLKPYVKEEDYTKIINNKGSETITPLKITEDGCVEFSAGYGPNLDQEVKYFAAVAETIAKHEEFDLIHAHDWPTFLAGKAVKEITGKPLITHLHSTEFDRNTGSINQNIYNWEKLGMEASDTIIAVSDTTRELLQTHYQQPPEKITTIYNAIEPTNITDAGIENSGSPKQEDSAVSNSISNTHSRIKSENTNPSNTNRNPAKIVTFLGRITAQKGPEFFIEAASLILKKMDNVRFVMAGDGDLWHEMIQLAAKKNITHRFHFTGFLHGNEVYDLLKMSDVYVMPSVSEPFGISTLEAIQSGVPVIVSKQSGVSEIIQNIIKVDYWDIDELADAIHALLQYPTLSNTIQQKAFKEIQLLSWDKTAEKVNSVYNHVLSNAKPEFQLSV